jgi:hypothetical protein
MITKTYVHPFYDFTTNEWNFEYFTHGQPTQEHVYYVTPGNLGPLNQSLDVLREWFVVSFFFLSFFLVSFILLLEKGKKPIYPGSRG